MLSPFYLSESANIRMLPQKLKKNHLTQKVRFPWTVPNVKVYMLVKNLSAVWM
uniref:Uncharacterized protein n=1 Tax=Arion vulgaris TaxID=1028688 RepID=A0A0B7A284_9EUPU